MNVLIDANVALDVILERQPWLGDSKGVWDACYQNRVTGHLVATSLTNLFYVSRRIIGTEKARAGYTSASRRSRSSRSGAWN